MDAFTCGVLGGKALVCQIYLKSYCYSCYLRRVGVGGFMDLLNIVLGDCVHSAVRCHFVR